MKKNKKLKTIEIDFFVDGDVYDRLHYIAKRASTTPQIAAAVLLAAWAYEQKETRKKASKGQNE